MNTKEDRELSALIEQATAGDKAALETVLTGVQDLVFNLSLRMLGTFHDAEDASQDILVKVMTRLSSFRGESAFDTWVFRIAVNHLRDYKKHLFAQSPLSFEFYGEDIRSGMASDVPDLTGGVDTPLLARELKLSCTNVMLQCLDPESRCAFILGTMFHLDSRAAGDILDLTPEAYRQRLSRARRRMADFLSDNCGEYGNGTCRCANRVNYAIQNRRIAPDRLEFTAARPSETALEVTAAMEELDGLAQQFSFCRLYQSPERLKGMLRDILEGPAFSAVARA